MQMYVTQRAYADFITWTPQACLIFRVTRDDEFISPAISVMQSFWSQHISPKLQEMRDAAQVSDVISFQYAKMARKKSLWLAIMLFISLYP